MAITELMWPAGRAFAIAFVLCPIFRDVFRSYNIVDRPGRRKVHAYPIPRIGGIPLAIAFGIGLLSYSSSASIYEAPEWKFLPATAIIFLTGLADDFFQLKPAYKFLGEIAAAGVAFWSGLRIEALGDALIPVWISLPVTIFWLLLVTNALNLIDGLDGLCAGLGFIGALTFFAVAFIQGNVSLGYGTLPLAGALLGFLCYNFNPATMFLGDSGALLIGFVLGCYGVAAFEQPPVMTGLAVPLLALAIPLTDVALSIIRRFLGNRPIFQADRGHLHHRLLDRGLSPRQAVFGLYLVATLGALFAILLSAPSLARYRVLVLLGTCLTAWAGIRHLRYAEFGVTGKLLFRGEFRRAVESRVRLEHLAAALQRCDTEHDWWNTLVNAAKDFGWWRLKWTGHSPTREEVFKSERPDWSFDVEVGAGEQFQIGGPFQPSSAAVNIVDVAEIIRGSLTIKRSEWSGTDRP